MHPRRAEQPSSARRPALPRRPSRGRPTAAGSSPRRRRRSRRSKKYNNRRQEKKNDEESTGVLGAARVGDGGGEWGRVDTPRWEGKNRARHPARARALTGDAAAFPLPLCPRRVCPRTLRGPQQLTRSLVGVVLARAAAQRGAHWIGWLPRDAAGGGHRYIGELPGRLRRRPNRTGLGGAHVPTRRPRRGLVRGSQRAALKWGLAGGDGRCGPPGGPRGGGCLPPHAPPSHAGVVGKGTFPQGRFVERGPLPSLAAAGSGGLGGKGGGGSPALMRWRRATKSDRPLITAAALPCAGRWRGGWGAGGATGRLMRTPTHARRGRRKGGG